MSRNRDHRRSYHLDKAVIEGLNREIEAQQIRLSRVPFGTHDHLVETDRLVAMQNQKERYLKQGGEEVL